MKKNKYLEFLFKDFPVLFVEQYNDVTEDLLTNNNLLFEKALNLDMSKLDLNILFNSWVTNY